MCQDLSYNLTRKMTTKTTMKKLSSTENLYMHLNASELSAISMKGSPNSNDRDAGFCSGSSEGGDDLSIDQHSRLDPCSPTNASEDSLEVKVTPISLVRNKRKSSEPSKVIESRAIACGPLKKRIRYTSSADSGVVLTPPTVSITPAAASSPSPPSSASTQDVTATAAPQLWDPSQILPHELMPNPAQVFVRHPGVTTLHRLPQQSLATAVPLSECEQIEPLALVSKKSKIIKAETCQTSTAATLSITTPEKHLQQHNSITKAPATVPPSTSSSNSTSSTDVRQQAVARARTCDLLDAVAMLNDDESLTTASPTASTSTSAKHANGTRPQQRNYKNMTRERRIEANARERTRVHTISAAYETLRKAVPSYSNAQKLSKLSVLRVACSYILTLSRMAGEDYSEDQSEPSLASCFDAVTATIQTEGKIRKKKEE